MAVGDVPAEPRIRASFADTKGRWWSVFGLAMMSLLLILAGVLALVVGVFVALVLVHQAWVVYWRSIEAHAGAGAGAGREPGWTPA